MATTKNITMKQFNGTDYDTLYPKTKVEQIENLTPSSIGAVNKSGDTMTGNLTIKNPSYSVLSLRSDGDAKGGDIEGGPNTINLVQFTEQDGSQFRQFSLRGIDRQPNAKIALEYVVSGEGENATYKVLHTGNLSSLSIARIQTGSYVGTGTYGSDNPCSLTFDFIPKFIIFPNLKADNGEYFNSFSSTADADFMMLNPQVLTTAYVEGTGFGREGSRRPYGAKSKDGKTIYWWNQTAPGQFNQQNYTYYWVAFG